jgi:site-specific DNA-cytosine methylase
VSPKCIDLFCGLGGWSEAFIEEGYECIGYDIEAHDYGTWGNLRGHIALRGY